MLINYNDMEETIIPNFKGGEKSIAAKMYVDDLNRIMHGRLEPGASIGLHTHEGSSEIVYILKGKGKAIYNDTEESLFPGVCHYCPEGSTHSIINNGTEDLIFLAIVPVQGK